MKPLEAPNSHYLRAAQGWLELGCAREALKELEQVSRGGAKHPDVLEAKWNAQAALKDWEGCAQTGFALVKAAPRWPAGWIHRSFALHEMKYTHEAAILLLPAAQLFPDHWLVCYNLACYYSQLDRFDDALTYLHRAFELGEEKEVRELSLRDPDLKKMRDKMLKYWKKYGDKKK